MSVSPPSPGAQAEAIFKQALERLVPEERTAFVEAACAGDTALRAAVGALLHDYAERCLREQTVAGPASGKPALGEGPGSIIGRYRLAERLGEGGCGIVFRAEQTEPVQRQVALKIIRLGMDTEEVVARFEAERQALALMAHPHIAQVLDAGATPAGRPFFVMELVRGEPVTKFCDDHRLGTAARLRLFVQICQAVQHAHQKGVIHRDLKPSNILVGLHDGVPAPKVIDFGIAKATAGRLTDKTLFTAYEQFVGTPAYMSPEQAGLGGADVDTRSDIYSLGVLLYELLTGQPPLAPEKLLAAGVDEVRRLVREVEPLRPSAQLTMLTGDTLTARARQHDTDATRLVSGIRGDLDWIVMRCLEKDRARRYDSVSALAEDITRHLRNEPIAARPPGNLYLLQKMVRRHRVVFATAAAVSLALLLGFGAALRSYFNEREARAETVTALARSDYLRAIDLLADNKDPEAVAHLVRALRAQPDDRAAATLLASMLTQRAWAVPVASTSTSQPVAVTPAVRGGQPGNRGGLFPARGGGRGGRGALGGRGGRGAPDGRGGPLAPTSAIRSPDGTLTLHSDPQENFVRLLSASTSLPVFEPMRLAGNFRTATFSADGKQLTTITSELAPEQHLVWEHRETWAMPAEPALLRTLPYTNGPVFLSPDGRVYFSNSCLWDATTGRPLSPRLIEYGGMLEAAFSPDSRRIATVTANSNDVRVWDASTGQPATPVITDDFPGRQRGFNNGRTLTVAFSPDGKFLLLTGDTARVRDAATGQPVPALQPMEATRPVAAAFSPDGARIVTLNADGVGARVWDATTGAQVREFARDSGSLRTVAFSPDGTRIATATDNGIAHLWDAATGEPASDPIQQGETPLSVTFSADGAGLLTFSRGDHAARVWDAATGEPMSALIQVENTSASPNQPGPNLANRPAPFSAAFSPDGRWVVTHGEIARVWDPTTGLPVSVPFAAAPVERESGPAGLTQQPPTPAIVTIVITSDGHHLLTFDSARHDAIRVWPSGDAMPAWLPDLAEALARCRLDATGSLEFFPGVKSIAELQRLVAQEKDAAQPLVIWARRLLSLSPADAPSAAVVRP